MPTITPPQKIDATQRHGNGFVDIVLSGDKYDEAAHAAHAFVEKSHAAFLHPFDDWDVIRGQGTVAAEIAGQVAALRQDLKAVLVPVGGGGLMAGTILALKDTHPHTQIIGVEPAGAACMTESLKAGHPVTLATVDTFVDGAAVARPGESEHETGLAFDIIDAGNADLWGFEGTPQEKWLKEHCWDYGFIVRYPPDKAELTGIASEPWHFRYVGLPHSQTIHEQGLCLEEYLAR